MPSSDTRRDTALESIARSLKSIDDHLAIIAKNSKKGVTVVNSAGRPDAFSQPQEPQPGDVVVESSKPGKDGPTFPRSDNPYFKQRTSDVAEPARDSGLGYEGPYGDGNGTPYS